MKVSSGPYADACEPLLFSSMSLLRSTFFSRVRKNLTSDTDGGACRRPSRVESEMCDRLGQFVFGHAVFESPFQMEWQFVRPIEYAISVATVIKLRSRLDSPGRSQISPKSTLSVISAKAGATSAKGLFVGVSDIRCRSPITVLYYGAIMTFKASRSFIAR